MAPRAVHNVPASRTARVMAAALLALCFQACPGASALHASDSHSHEGGSSSSWLWSDSGSGSAWGNGALDDDGEWADCSILLSAVGPACTLAEAESEAHRIFGWILFQPDGNEASDVGPQSLPAALDMDILVDPEDCMAELLLPVGFGAHGIALANSLAQYMDDACAAWGDGSVGAWFGAGSGSSPLFAQSMPDGEGASCSWTFDAVNSCEVLDGDDDAAAAGSANDDGDATAGDDDGGSSSADDASEDGEDVSKASMRRVLKGATAMTCLSIMLGALAS